MKVCAFILTLYFSLFAACGAFAAKNSLVSDYPSPSGSYNKIVIAPQATTSFTCASANDLGQIYYNSGTKNLQLCAKVNGAFTTVLSSETCFNRYCSVNALTTTSCFAASPCPGGYTQAKSSGTPIADYFQTTVNGNYTVFTTACCSSGSPVLPT